MAAKRPQILVLTGELSGKRFDIPDGGLRMGRSSSNDLHIPDEELSRNHCLFEPDGKDSIRIIDLASANGTYVNSVQLDASALVLKIGDIIEAGRTSMKVIENEIQETIVTRAAPHPPSFFPPPQSQPAPSAPPPPPVMAAPPPPPPPKPPTEPPKTSSEAPKPPTGVVDLGLDTEARGADIVAEASPGWKGDNRNSMRLNILWGTVAVLCASAIALMLFLPPPEGNANEEQTSHAATKAVKGANTLKMLRYEKINADSRHIFRLEISLNSDHKLTAVCDDVPGEGRHVTKTKELSEENMAELAGIFTNGWEHLKHSYTGQSSVDENRLDSYRIFTIMGNGAKEVLVENREEPRTFRLARERLEEFANNALDLWTMTRSRSDLMERISECVRLADSKMADRDVEYGNISAAIAHYSEAVSYAKQFEPRPEGYNELRKKLDYAEAMLQARYEEERKAISVATEQSDWNTVIKHLEIILRMIPNQADRRHKKASDDLYKVNGLFNKKGRGKKR